MRLQGKTRTELSKLRCPVSFSPKDLQLRRLKVLLLLKPIPPACFPQTAQRLNLLIPRFLARASALEEVPTAGAKVLAGREMFSS